MKKYYWGMSIIQIAILGLTLTGVCGMLGIAGLYTLNPSTLAILTQPKISTSQLTGKWTLEVQPAPTTTMTPTPNATWASMGFMTQLAVIQATPNPTKDAERIQTQEARPTADLCINYYPQTIEFFEDGTYINYSGNSSTGFEGKYEVLEDGRIKFAFGSLVSIKKMTLTGDTLIFHTDKGCTEKYDRTK